MKKMCLGLLLLVAPLLGRAQDTNTESICREHLQRLGAAARVFSMIHEGKSLAKLSDLYYEGLANDPSMYVCPATGHAPPAAADIDSKSDYTLETLSGATNMVIREKAPHPGSATLLAAFTDGKVQAVPAPGGAASTPALAAGQSNTASPPTPSPLSPIPPVTGPNASTNTAGILTTPSQPTTPNPPASSASPIPGISDANAPETAQNSGTNFSPEPVLATPSSPQANPPAGNATPAPVNPPQITPNPPVVIFGIPATNPSGATMPVPVPGTPGVPVTPTTPPVVNGTPAGNLPGEATTSPPPNAPFTPANPPGTVGPPPTPQSPSINVSGLPPIFNPPATNPPVIPSAPGTAQLPAANTPIRGYLGVQVQSATNRNNGVPVLLVRQVTPGAPASISGGLQNGDVILSVNGVPIANSQQFAQQVRGSTPGTRLDLFIVRQGKYQLSTVWVGNPPTASAVAGNAQPNRLPPSINPGQGAATAPPPGMIISRGAPPPAQLPPPPTGRNETNTVWRGPAPVWIYPPNSSPTSNTNPAWPGATVPSPPPTP
jgi:hypothetical protein